MSCINSTARDHSDNPEPGGVRTGETLAQLLAQLDALWEDAGASFEQVELEKIPDVMLRIADICKRIEAIGPARTRGHVVGQQAPSRQKSLETPVSKRNSS